MKTSKLWCLIISTLYILTACNGNKDHEAFRMYLKESFNKDIPIERTEYLILPSNQCYNCFKPLKPINQGNNFFIVTGIGPENFNGVKNLYFDTTDKVSMLPLAQHSNTLVITENGKVVSINNNIPKEAYFK